MDRLPQTGVSPTSSSDLSPSRAPLTTVAVVGLGTMGTGIAEILARAGRQVIGIDISESAGRRAVTALEVATARAVGRGRMTERERTAALDRFRTATDVSAAADADLVIEVVPEDHGIKRDVFAALDAVVRPDTILSTGTNAFMSCLAAAGSYPFAAYRISSASTVIGISRKLASPSRESRSNGSVPSINAPAAEINARFSIGSPRRSGVNGEWTFSIQG